MAEIGADFLAEMPPISVGRPGEIAFTPEPVVLFGVNSTVLSP
jgi:hypothetical protein|tara:strand:- start:1066 stop:1194 length:129 start_codon:yes stop_codon:yes gene_type:complete